MNAPHQSQQNQQSDETRTRFLAAIANRVNPDAIAEVHLFQPMKQGGTESGVAVVAVKEPRPSAGESFAENDDHTDAEGVAENSPAARGAAAENPSSVAENRASAADNVAARLAIYTAKYRLTQKGPERGKWEFAMNAEADAPLITVDVVVRGVQRRMSDAEEPEKLSGEEFRERLPLAPSA